MEERAGRMGLHGTTAFGGEGESEMADEPKNGLQASGRRRLGGWLLWLLALLLIMPWLLNMLGLSGAAARHIDYSTFRTLVAAGNVAEVSVRGEEIRGRLSHPQPVPEAAQGTGGGTKAKGEKKKGAKPETYTHFVTYLPSFGDDALLGLLEKHDVAVETHPVSTVDWGLILVSVLPFIILIGIGVMVIRRMRGQGQQLFSMGKSKAKLYQRRDEATTFADVAGAEGAKTELREIIEFLRRPDRVRRLGGKPPTGLLLVGPPGTGKTLLARATAGEAEVPFFIITGSDFMEMFVGVGASRVRNLFADVRRSAPAIVFIDELDSIGRRRGAGLGGGNDEREQTLNQLLSEMDGFEPQTGVIVMAATNRPDILDPALLRPGRFDRRIVVDMPARGARRAILDVHSRDKPLGADVDLDELAGATPGFSGADLENLLNEAALLAARNGKNEVGAADIDEARDKIMLGLEREGMVLTDDEVELLAYHEGGHAVVAATLPNADPIHKVTIVPRGRAMGVTQQLPTRDRYVYSRDFMLDRLAVMMGGRAAEELVLNTSTSGAENDLKEATRLARKMVLDWGMSEHLEHLAFGGQPENVFLGEELAKGRDYSDATAREVDEEIRTIARVAFERATATLEEHRDGLDRLAAALKEHEEVMGARVLEILGLDPKEVPAKEPEPEPEPAATP